MADHLRFHLYELCVQSPADMTRLLRAVHAGSPTVLGEDFCSTAATSRHWCDTIGGGKAIAVDHDPEVFALCRDHPGITTVHADVRECAEPVDVLFAGNFSIGYMHRRDDAIAYLRHARSRLNPGGVFLCDTYGGESAFIRGRLEREVPVPEGSPVPGTHVLYTWEQRDADPLSARVLDVLHFRLFDSDEVIADLPDAFTYDWRLWSPPELHDMMREAGFSRVDVYGQLPDAEDDEGNVYTEPVSGEDLDDSFIVCVAARG